MAGKSRIPPIPGGLAGAELVAAINDRLRRLDQLLSEVNVPIVVALNELILAVPGILAINSNAAPLVSVPSNFQPGSLVGLVKTAPTGSGLTFSVYAGVTLIGTGTISAGNTSVTVSGGLALIPANAVVTLSITAVGATIAGADLTVMVRP